MVKCPIHPRYQVKRKPTANCNICRNMWEDKQRFPPKPLSSTITFLMKQFRNIDPTYNIEGMVNRYTFFDYLNNPVVQKYYPDINTVAKKTGGGTYDYLELDLCFGFTLRDPSYEDEYGRWVYSYDKKYLPWNEDFAVDLLTTTWEKLLVKQKCDDFIKTQTEEFKVFKLDAENRVHNYTTKRIEEMKNA